MIEFSTRSVHYQVDQLLLEQGEYLPLEFLLQEGRLSYADYEAWRAGELVHLDQALFGDPQQVREELAAAERYLRDRGWRAEPVRYEPWSKLSAPSTSESTPECLRFSADSGLDACFHRSYRKPQDHPQLDLFTDSPATCLVNGIIRSLAERQPVEARRELERLADVAPDHARLGELERLTEALESLDSPVNDARAELQWLQQTLTPLAAKALGPARQNFLVPLWRRLSQALQDQPYSPDAPELHLSYTAAQALDWAGSRRAAEREPGWRNDPVMLLRHALACDQQRDHAAALSSWFTVCWRFPERAHALEASVNDDLRQHWSAFQDLDPELPVQSFPAWLLMNRPGLRDRLGEPEKLSVGCPESYRTLSHLLRLPRPQGKAGADEMTLRAQLKREDPVLFRYFLGAVSRWSGDY